MESQADLECLSYRWPIFRPVLYIDSYFWLVLISMIDVIVTCITIASRGTWITPALDSVIIEAGWPAIIALKLLLITFVVVFCEEIGRRRPTTGRRIVNLATVVTVIAVIMTVMPLSYTLP